MIEALLQDSGGQLGALEFPGATAAEKATAETFCDTYSGAGLYGMNEITSVAVTATAAATGADLDRRALIFGKAADDSNVRICILAPLFSGTMTDEGERISAATGQDICDDWAAMLGQDVTFLSGIIVEKE